MVKNRPKFSNGKQQKDPLIVAIQRGNLELVQNIVNKAGLNFYETWTEGYALLCTAIKYHRSQMALWFISKGCRINRVNEEDISDTPIHLAIYNNQTDIAKALIEKGACLNVKNYRGETPLHISCQRRNFDVTELLLNDDSIADVPDSRLTTPMHIAVEIECLEIVELLLKHKVDVNAYTVKDDFKGFTPLHIAVCKRNEKIVRMLLDNGADVHAPVQISNLNGFQNENLIDFIYYQNFMPLHLASKVDDGDIMELLINHDADVDAAIKHSDITALHIAVENKNKRNVILLSEYNANFKAKTKEGKNVLHLAVENDWPELIEVLLLKGADINIQTVDGETPLHIAVEMGDENIVELLIIYEADVNIINFMHQSPLHFAAEFSVDITRILLVQGANVDEVDNNNETPLGIAVKYKDIEIIKEILQYKPCIQNSSNQDAFLFAITNPDYFYVKVVDLLLEYGFRITEKIDNMNLFCNSIAEGHIRIVHYLLEHGMDVSKNQDNNSLLHYAVKCQNYDVVKLLIDYNCNVNAVDLHGQTPIGYAIECNNIKILNFLLSRGANILNITSSLLNAAKESHIVLLQILLKYGADINVSDEFGTTILHFAVWNKHLGLIQILLNKSANVNTTLTSSDKTSATDNDNEETDDSYFKEFKKQVFTSPLHIAVNKKSKTICSTLLEHHANVNSRDGYGRTALHLAAAIKSTEQQNLVKLLISYGADINAIDDFKRLPIYYIYNQTCVCSVAFQNQYEIYSECECDLYEDYDINDVIEVFVKHIALLASINKFVHIDNLKIISKSDFSEKLQISCLHEIEKMKEEKIGDCLSVYDVLIKKSNSLAACARNEDIIQTFELTNYRSKFPLYYNVLKEQFDTARARAYWLQCAASALNSLLKFKLPEVIAENIFETLLINDLQNLSIASISSSSNHASARKKLKVY
ncbi:ankyrin-3 [Nasonia vitripennis]|uniref:Uncharacterized protein n=1 Tax=Nasonia vitripennis TaxID=7425 RepID=A0A7M7HA38_NASVI|nr:ankyrin-3 [Nasonia vitripennis]XP_008213955.1 ankyrin-3 [Nasonia vitripennis]